MKKCADQVSEAPAPHRLAIRVYYEDTDFSGVVYHASYLRFLERGRTEFLRAHGIEHRAVFERGVDAYHFAVRAMSLDFRKPAVIDDVLLVETRIDSIGGASIAMDQAILRDGAVLLDAKVKIAVISAGRAIRLPASLRAKFEPEP